MLDMAEKLSDAGLVPDRPAKTTFPDGRMATKEAWNYCTAVCAKRKVKAPTLRTFKWHLKHGNLIEAARVPNPFGGAGPDKVYAITCEAVIAFIDELEKRPGELDVVDQPTTKKGVQRRGVKGTPPPPELTFSTPPEAPPKPKKEDRELKADKAFAYLHKKVAVRSDLSVTTFGFYLAYDVIPSRLVKGHHYVKVGDLDAYLELAPDGVYANHIDYLVAPRRGPGELSLKDAFDYYSKIDPHPISLNSFRSIVAAGIIPAIRTANEPKAMVVGFRPQDINGFLATRQRVQEKGDKARAADRAAVAAEKATKTEDKKRATLVARVMQDALAHAKLETPSTAPVVEVPEPKKATKKAVKKTSKKVAKTTPKKSPAPTAPVAEDPPVVERKTKTREPRWVPTKDAYAYYEERAKRPFTDSWFRDKVYRSDLFQTKTEKDERSNNPSGKKYLVDLNSVDDYLAQDPKTKPKPQKSWPVEKAYHKFEHLIPAGLSMLQFKQLVNGGLIRSFTRSSVVHVRLDAVEAYFEGLAEKDPERVLQTGAAYNYYCSRCTDPVQKAHFSRWIAGGEIEGAVKNEDGIWTITVGLIDDFVERHPSGRMRPNRNSRVAAESRVPKRKKTKKEGPSKPTLPLPVVTESKGEPTAPAPGSMGSVSVSLRDYPSAADMKTAIALLQSQGFDVQVKP
jgi:hypothetical protein